MTLVRVRISYHKQTIVQREREKDLGRETDRQTDRQAGRQTDRDTQIYRGR